MPWEEKAKSFLLGEGSNRVSLLIYCIGISTPQRPRVLSPGKKARSISYSWSNRASLSIYCIWISIPFRVHRSYIHVLIHLIKIICNILMGFKIVCQVSKFDAILGVVVKNFKIT